MQRLIKTSILFKFSRFKIFFNILERFQENSF